MASSGVNKLTKDEYKKAKELEEARKAGTAPPALDEDGNAVNPHIPSYIANAPCMYLGNVMWRGGEEKRRGGYEKEALDEDGLHIPSYIANAPCRMFIMESKVERWRVYVWEKEEMTEGHC